MKTITEPEARSLIMSGTAGYWGIHERSIPIEHDETIVVRLQGGFWLCDTTEIKVEFVGYVGDLAGKPKGGWSIQLIAHEIIHMAQTEMQQRGRRLSVAGDGQNAN